MITGITLRNFLSWKTLDHELTKGVTLIDGWNEDDQTSEGSGKSAILNAMCWAFYGKIPKDANIDDVIKEGEKSCSVEVRFTGGVIIHRTRGPNELAMIVGHKTVKGKDANETQKLIIDFLGLTFETFCQTIYFAQNYPKKFISANQEDKGKILSEVQDLTVFDKSGKEVTQLIKIEKESIVKLEHSKDLANKDIELTKRDILAERAAVDHALQAQAQRIQNLNTQIKAQEMQNASLVEQQAQRIKHFNDELSQANLAIQQHIATKEELLSAAATLVYDEPKEKELLKANDALMGEIGAISAELKTIDQLVAKRTNAQTQGKRYVARHAQLQAEIAKNEAFIANPSQNCPTCNTKLADCDTSHAVTEVARLNEETNGILESLELLSAEVDAPIPTKEELNQRLIDIGQKRLANDSEIRTIRAVRDQMNRVAANLNSIDQNIKNETDRAGRIQVQLTAVSAPIFMPEEPLKSLRAQLIVESVPLQFDGGPLEALENKLTTLESALADFIRLIGEKNKHLARLEDLKIGFKEIKSYVFNSMLNEINARVQKYLGHLFEVPVSVRFRNEDMKIETDVRFDGAERGLGLLSGGQFRRVSLAVDLALSDVVTSRKGSQVGVLILDEYFKDLSENSMEKCLTLLEGRGQPVLLIEHNSIFKNIVNNSLMVRLEDGTSSVEV